MRNITPEFIERIKNSALELFQYAIREHKDSIPGLITEKMVRHLALAVEFQNWDTVLYVYGLDFLLAILDFYEVNEDFERCNNVVAAIKAYNDMMGDNLPTHHTENFAQG